MSEAVPDERLEMPRTPRFASRKSTVPVADAGERVAVSVSGVPAFRWGGGGAMPDWICVMVVLTPGLVAGVR